MSGLKPVLRFRVAVWALALVLAGSLSACESLEPYLAELVGAAATPGATSGPQVTGTLPAASPTAALTGQASTPDALETTETALPPAPMSLQLWVPPQFDPAAGTPGGTALANRLAAFSAETGVQVDVRLKALEGAGGMLESLTTASAAAPLALPDLALLSRPQMEAAALKGLLYPYDERTEVLEELDWYDFGRELARLQSSTFGLPVAGDVQALVYRPEITGEPPPSLAAILEAPGPLAFPAADPQALFTLAQYQAAGGEVQDEQGRPLLQREPLEEILVYYQSASEAGLIPFWVTQFTTDEQVWQAFVEGETNLAATWVHRYLSELQEGAALAALPTPDGRPYALAGGWVLALANPQVERQAQAAGLAEYLVDPAFLGEWTEAAGYVPPRAGALDRWVDQGLAGVLARVAISAHLYPSADLLTSLGPALEEATVAVLKDQSDPLQAAEAAVSTFSSP